jgi:hypothetical protein
MFGDTPQKDTLHTGTLMSRHDNQINIKIVGGLYDYFRRLSNSIDRLVTHLDQVFARDSLEPELTRFSSKRDAVVSKLGGLIHGHKLYVHQVQQRVVFSSRHRRLVKRGRRIIADSIGQRIL